MFVLAMTSACSHQKPSVARRLEQWFLVRQPELGVATKRLRGQCFAGNCPVQIGNDSSDLTRGLKLLRCKLVRMGDVFRGLAVGFSSTPFQTPPGAIGKARDPKSAGWSLCEAGHIGTIVGTYSDVQPFPPLYYSLDSRLLQTGLVEPWVRIPLPPPC